MNPDQLWAELKRRRVVRVAVAYAAAVFVVLQVADLTFEPLGLPGWAYRILLIAAIAGFPVAVALAWAFDVTPEGVRKEASGEPVRGRVMGRTIIGAAVVLAVVVGFWQLRAGPEAVVADGVDTGLIAVVPFRVASADERVTILREGIVDMLSPIFSSSPRTVDSGAMISAWRREAGEGEADLSEGQAVELARRLGAGRVLVGSVVGTGENFALNARLLRVPGGEVIGDASVDGSAGTLRETISTLAAQILSMEAGVARGQVDYLDDVPLEALQAYLEGRRLYRRNSYAEAREAYLRALDVDTTFSLAALGVVEALEMGTDADRFNTRARAVRLLEMHGDGLPPREREYARIWLLEGDGRRSAAEILREERTRLVTRLPDKAEAWYLYADWLMHGAFRVGDPDWIQRATDALERAAELDPGLAVVREHLVYALIFAPELDSTALRREAAALIEADPASETAAGSRWLLAFAMQDPEAVAWARESIDTLSFASAQRVTMTTAFPLVRAPAELVDRAFDRIERLAVAEDDRTQVLTDRYAYLRSAGRSDEADAHLRLIEATMGPRPRAWIEAFLYWDGLEESAASAARVLDPELAGDAPLYWTENGLDACVLELWRLRQGDVSRVTSTVDRLRAGADDPDPTHGRNALCALALETFAAHRRGDADAGEKVARMLEVMDQGPATVYPALSLELAWILEARGELGAAARVAGYQSGTNPWAFAGSTVYRESGRLRDAAGDVDGALRAWRWFLQLRDPADPRFAAQGDSIAERVRELEARRAGR